MEPDVSNIFLSIFNQQKKKPLRGGLPRFSEQGYNNDLIQIIKNLFQTTFCSEPNIDSYGANTVIFYSEKSENFESC